MSDVTVWGLLPKAQDDATTIAEAIAAALAAHNADPTAHMDPAASLGLHRQNDIIDHPAGSVLTDKNTLTEWQYLPDLFDDAIFSTVENNSNWDPGNPPASFVGAFGTGEYCFREGLPSGIATLLDYTKEILVQWTATLNLNANGDSYLFLGEETTRVPNKGFGFHFDGLTLTGFYQKTGSAVVTSSLTFVNNDLNIMRAHYDPILNAFSFYVNGTLAATLSAVGTTKVTGDGRFIQGCKAKNASSDCSIALFTILYSLSV